MDSLRVIIFNECKMFRSSRRPKPGDLRSRTVQMDGNISDTGQHRTSQLNRKPGRLEDASS